MTYNQLASALTIQQSVQLELEAHIVEQADTIAPEIEIDSVVDDFGLLYRVWYGSQLLGTFYRADSNDKWVAQPCSADIRLLCNTNGEAQLIILAISGLLVADTAA